MLSYYEVQNRILMSLSILAFMYASWKCPLNLETLHYSCTKEAITEK